MRGKRILINPVDDYCNLKGELIGLNTLKLAADNVENMGFSIPSNILKILAED